MAIFGNEGMAAYAATSPYQPHRARDAIQDAHKKKIPPLIGYYAGLSALPITRLVTPMNFDCVWIDWEHSSCKVDTMISMVHETMIMSHGRTIPWVRVPGHDHAAIGYALGAGASIIITQVDTVEQARDALSATKYGTRQNGTRSAPPFRLVPTLTDTPCDTNRALRSCLNDQVAVMIQVETLEGINNLEAILTEVPDIDIVWLGTPDARVKMNLPANHGFGGDEAEWQFASKRFFEVIDKLDKPYAGFAFITPPYGSPDSFKQAAERMCMIIPSADVLHLASMLGDLQASRKLLRST